jgi:hypothetical protein
MPQKSAGCIVDGQSRVVATRTMGDMYGTLVEDSPAELCLRLAKQTASGTLRLDSPRGRATVRFDAGRLTDVHAPGAGGSRGKRVGERLVTAGVVRRPALEALLAEQVDLPGRTLIGELLVDRGLVRPDYVRLAVQEQILEGLTEILSWHVGEYELDVEEGALPTAVAVAVPVERAITEARRRIGERDEIQRLVPTPTTVPRPAQDPPDESTLELDGDERALLAAVDGLRSVGSIAAEMGLSVDDASRLLYRLALQGLVERAEASIRRPDDDVEVPEVQATANPVGGGVAVALDDQGWADRRLDSDVDEPEPWVGWANGKPVEPEPRPEAATTHPTARWSSDGADAATGPDPGSRLGEASTSAPAAPPPATPQPERRSVDADTRRALFTELSQVSRDLPTSRPAPEQEPTPSAAATPEPAPEPEPEPETPPERPRRERSDTDVSELLRELHALSQDDD